MGCKQATSRPVQAWLTERQGDSGRKGAGSARSGHLECLDQRGRLDDYTRRRRGAKKSQRVGGTWQVWPQET
eukprot:symbB.v1.2.022929.t2/scaffold2056.1/size90925/3